MCFITYFSCFALILFGLAPAWGTEKKAAVDPAWNSLAFRIEDSRAFVGLAPVYLKVSKLRPESGNLVGTYKIEVPLMSSKNDQGKIVLPLDLTVKDLGAKGGTLRGKAHSDRKESETNLIVCEILPEKDQMIKLAITTDQRTIKFKSRYTVIETEQDGVELSQ